MNGLNAADVSLKDLRSQISVIPQFGFIFRSSLRDNLDPHGSVPEEHISHIMESLGIHWLTADGQKTAHLEEEVGKLGFQIEASGKNLSTGQK